MAEDLVTELRAWGTNGYMMQAADEIERLREELDDLRWEVCELSSNGSIDDSMRVAKERGWGCFKENT